MNKRLGVELVSVIMDGWLLEVPVLKEHGLNEGEIERGRDRWNGIHKTSMF